MSNSKLPNGGYTLTHGSNYMMDGFQFDTEYNGGVLEKARLPESKGLSTLPSGMIPPDTPLNSDLPSGVEVDFDLDLSDFTKDASEQLIPLVDHSWLASQPQEDLDGMRSHDEVLEHFSEGRFEHPQANQLKTLQDSWADGSTTGLDIIPNKQRAHDKYHNSYSEPQASLPGDDYRRKKEEASRKVAYGVLPTDTSELTRETLSELSSEYGLHGKVYIKESSFKGLFNGRWDEVIRSRCASAMYIISENPDCAYDRFLGMKVVASENEIPWKEAYQTLMPKLEVYGVTKVSGSSYKNMLKHAFIDVIEGRVASPSRADTWFHIQADPTQGLSYYEAQRQLHATEIEQDVFFSQEEVAETKEAEKLKRTASQLVQQGLLEAEQAEAILADSSKTASQRLDRLYEVSSMPQKSSSYEGYGKEATYHISERPQMETQFKSREELSFEKRANLATSKIEKLVKAGFLTNDEAIKVSQANKNNPELAVQKAFEKATKKSFEEAGLYVGVGDNVTYMTKKQASIETKFKTRGEVTFAQRAQKAQNTVARLIKAGLISVSDLDGFEKMKGSPEEKLLKVYEKAASKGYEKADYAGLVYDQNSRVSVAEMKRMQEAFFRKASSQTQAQYEQQVMRELSRVLKAGLISQSEMDKVISKHASLEARLQEIYRIATKRDAQKSTGATGHYGSPTEGKPNEISKKVASDRDWKNAKDKVSRLIQAGLLTEEQHKTLNGIKDHNVYVERAFKMAYAPQEVGTYEGEETAHILNNKKSSERLASEMKVATWLRQKMSEGSAGQELDALLASRFSQSVLETHKERIASLRSEHEGVSGHAYVDAEAYMTQGTEGCEKGALIHRANQVPALLKTAKCGACVFNSGGTCQKYNKVVVASSSEIVENKAQYQSEMIRLANSSDSERTASLFVNNYDEGEFSLQQDNLVDFDDAPSVEKVGDILFGGFEI